MKKSQRSSRKQPIVARQPRVRELAKTELERVVGGDGDDCSMNQDKNSTP